MVVGRWETNSEALFDKVGSWVCHQRVGQGKVRAVRYELPEVNSRAKAAGPSEKHHVVGHVDRIEGKRANGMKRK